MEASSWVITGAVCCGAPDGRATSTMATATWKGVVIAQTDKFETVEGNVCVRCLVDARLQTQGGGGRGGEGGEGECEGGGGGEEQLHMRRGVDG